MKYYTLATRINGIWEQAFSDFDRDCVKFELDDYRDHGFKKKDLKILTTTPDQPAVDAAIAALNVKGE